MRATTRRSLWQLFVRFFIAALVAFACYQLTAVPLSQKLAELGLVETVANTMPIRQTRPSLIASVLLEFVAPIGGFAAFSALAILAAQFIATALLLPLIFRRAWGRPRLWIRCNRVIARIPYLLGIALVLLCLYFGDRMYYVGTILGIVLTVVGHFVFVKKQIKARAMAIVPLCSHCKFNLSQSDSSRCPECGAEFG